MWKCPKCSREFMKTNQNHVCSDYTENTHFEGKNPKIKELYEYFKEEARKKVGHFKIDVPKCCIHFVKSHTFAGIYVMKDMIRPFFVSEKKLQSKRVNDYKKISEKKYSYSVDVKDKSEIDEELMNWIKTAYDLDK